MRGTLYVDVIISGVDCSGRSIFLVVIWDKNWSVRDYSGSVYTEAVWFLVQSSLWHWSSQAERQDGVSEPRRDTPQTVPRIGAGTKATEWN